MKNITIMRGISGAGKSSYYKHYSRPLVVSADKFWGDNYDFDYRRIGEAHDWCKRKFMQAVLEGKRNIVVDNTNCRVEEIAPYYEMGQAFGYVCKIVTIWCDPQTAFKRNIHNVPPEKILVQYQNLIEARIPNRWNHVVEMGWGAES